MQEYRDTRVCTYVYICYVCMYVYIEHNAAPTPFMQSYHASLLQAPDPRSKFDLMILRKDPDPRQRPSP